MIKPVQVSSNQCSRLFVGGVVEPVSIPSLTSYFSKFGEVESCEIMAHPDTGVYKGFGFVTFKKIEDSQRALQSMDVHVVDGIRIEIKNSFSKRESQLREQQQAPRKVFIDNIPLSVDKFQLANFFSTFGEVQEANVMQKSKKHSFGFVVFKDEEVAQSLIGESLILAGGTIFIHQALSKQEMKVQKQKAKSAANSSNSAKNSLKKENNKPIKQKKMKNKSNPSTKPSSLVMNNNLFDRIDLQYNQKQSNTHGRNTANSAILPPTLRKNIEPRFSNQQNFNSWTPSADRWSPTSSASKVQCMCLKHRPKIINISDMSNSPFPECSESKQISWEQISYFTQKDLANMRGAYQTYATDISSYLLRTKAQNQICFDQYRYVFRINPERPNLRHFH